VHHYFGKQLSKWIPLLSFTILRADLLLLPFFTPLPACGLIPYCSFNLFRQAAQYVRKNMHQLLHLMVLPT